MSDTPNSPISVEEGRRILALFEALRDLPAGERAERIAAAALSPAGRDRLLRMLGLVDRTEAMMDTLFDSRDKRDV